MYDDISQRHDIHFDGVWFVRCNPRKRHTQDVEMVDVMNERRLVTSRTDKGPRLKALVIGGLMVVGHGGVMVDAGSTLASTPSSSSSNEMTVVAGERCCRSGSCGHWC